MQEHEEDTRM